MKTIPPEEINLEFNLDKDLFKPTPTRLKFLQEQVARLKKIPQPVQRSQEWYDFRDERITASDFATALGEHPHGDQLKLLLRKVTRDRTFFTNNAILWGVKYEDAAIQIYEHRNKVNVVEYGCISHPVYTWLGASPDGITDDGVMLEIKCPSSRQITGKIPSYYWNQVQGQLEVCELDRCDFLECRIKEYDSREEYEADNYKGNHFYNQYGFEKGIVVEYFKRDTKSLKFDYLPLGLRGKELDEAIEKSKEKFLNDNIIFSGVDYWYLEEVSCIPIYRNQEWFHSKIPTFRDFWDKVVKYRELGGEACSEYVKEQKELKKLLRKQKREEAKNAKRGSSSTRYPSSPKKTIQMQYDSLLMTDFVDAASVTIKKEEIFIGFEKKKQPRKSQKKDEEPDPYDEDNKPRPKLRFSNHTKSINPDESAPRRSGPKLRFSSHKNASTKPRFSTHKQADIQTSTKPRFSSHKNADKKPVTRSVTHSTKNVSDDESPRLARPKLRFSSHKQADIQTSAKPRFSSHTKSINSSEPAPRRSTRPKLRFSKS
jgi:putative phage-type endonuclease